MCFGKVIYLANTSCDSMLQTFHVMCFGKVIYQMDCIFLWLGYCPDAAGSCIYRTAQCVRLWQHHYHIWLDCEFAVWHLLFCVSGDWGICAQMCVRIALVTDLLREQWFQNTYTMIELQMLAKNNNHLQIKKLDKMKSVSRKTAMKICVYAHFLYHPPHSCFEHS